MTKPGYLITAGTAGMIDADMAGTTDFGTDGPPLAFFGSGRPDGLGDPAVSYNNTAIAAPTGSIYNWTGDDPDAVFGARVWRKSATDWVCVEGYCRMGGALPDGGTSFVSWLGNNQGFFETKDVPSKGGRTGTSFATPLPGKYLRQSQFTGGGRPGDNGEATSFWVTTGGISLGGLPSGVLYNVTAAVTLAPAWPDAVWVGMTLSLEELRELIAEIENDPNHPQHDQLQQLRDELTALTGTKPGDVS